MPDRRSKLAATFAELKRRRVVHVGVVYATVAFVLLQLLEIVLPALRLPDWTLTLVVVLLAVGFPVALVLAWAFEVTPEGVARTRPLPDTRADSPSGERSRRLWWALGLSLIVLGLVATWLWTRQPEAVGPMDRDVVAVLPFSVSGSGEYAFLAEGMVNLLSTSLSGAGELRAVDPRALLSLVKRENPSRIDPGAGRDVARRLGAGLYVLGDIVELGRTLAIRASVYDASRPGEPLGSVSVDGDSEKLPELIDEVAAGLLLNLTEGPAARVTRLAAVTTSSLPALKAYLEGEAALRSFRFEPAFEAFGRAVAIDSQFALAYYRRSVAAEWLTRADEARAAADAALERADRLSARDRQLLEAFRAFRRGRARAAEELYRSLLGTYPDDVEAWTYLGELLFHTNAAHGRPPEEARVPFERVLSLEPDHVPALVHLARLAARAGSVAEVETMVSRILEISPGGDRELEMQVLLASTAGWPDREGILARTPDASDLAIGLAIWDTGAFTHDLDGTELLTRRLVDPLRSVDARSFGHAVLGHAALGQGRWRDAVQELERGREVAPVAALEHLAFLAASEIAPAAAEEIAAIREALTAVEPSDYPDSESPSVWFNVHDGLHDAIREYLLGRLSVRLDDTTAALRHAERLDSLRLGAGTLSADLALGVRARIEDRAGRPEAALELLERIGDETWYEYRLTSPYFALPAERFHRAELLTRLGREQEALDWYANLVATSLYEIAYLGMAHLRQAQIHDRLRDREPALRHYRRFLELWRECDPELRPLVEEAEARFASLSG